MCWRGILTRQGYRVTVHVQRRFGARTASAKSLNACQVVLTDHGMPGKTGLQLVAEIKRVRADLPVLLLTGWGETVLRTHVAETLPDAVLGKPINQSRSARSDQQRAADRTDPSGVSVKR